MTKASPRVVLVSFLVVASLLATRRATGQEPESPNAGPPTEADSLPFRRGQWGAVFAINDGTVGLGALWFRSARKAWLINADVNALSSETESSYFGDSDYRDVFVNLRAGPRRYHSIAAGAAAYLGTGLTGGYSWALRDDVHRQTWQAGAYGELGALYFVTRRLSLGAQVELFASYYMSHEISPMDESRDRSVSVGTGPIRIVGALYF
jgi:hypothetical protein